MGKAKLVFFFLLGFWSPAFAMFGPGITFLENQGQWNPQARFRTQLGNNRVWFSPRYITHQLINGGLHPLAQVHSKRHKEPPETGRFFAHVYRIHFEGSNPVMPLESGSPTKTQYNFFIGKDSRTWKTRVRGYNKIVYPNLYPGINLTYYGSGDQLKYDFELAAGKNGSAISLLFEGISRPWLSEGKLRIRTALGVVEEHIPKAYQLVEGVAKVVPCQYELNGNRVSFKFPQGLDPKYPTVIDPVLNFFTYSGAQSDNWANTAVSDNMGNSYTAGTVYGASFPTTVGAFDRTYNGSLQENPYLNYDVGILKFNPTGEELLSCTFLGGTGSETPHSLAIDPEQHLVVLGTTSSPNFPTHANAFQKNFRGGPVEYPFGFETGFIFPSYTSGSDFFVFKLHENGFDMLASTLLGGNGTDGLMSVLENLVTNYGDQFRGDVIIDSAGYVYVAGSSHSTDFPLRGNPIQANRRGNMDGILCKFTPGLDELIWSTYFGGGAEDAIFSIRFLGDNQLVVCGGSNSTNLETTSGAYQRSRAGNIGIDGFLAVFDRNSGSLGACTYTGTPMYDQCYLVDTDLEGKIYVIGQTMGNMPRTAGTFGNNSGGQFLQKFTPDLQNLLWSTTIGTRPRQPNIVPTGLMVDSCHLIYISGWGGGVNYEGPGFAGGYTSGLPITNDAFKTVSGDSSDFYFLILDRDARSMLFGSYLGANSRRGEHVDGGTSRFDKRGTITQAVCGCRDNSNDYFRGTPNAFQPQIGSSNCNNGVMKVNLLHLKAKIKIETSLDNLICPATLILRNESENGLSYTWFFGNGDSLVTNERVISYQYSEPGTYIIRLRAFNPRTCKILETAVDSVYIPGSVTFPRSFPADSFCVGDTLRPVFEILKPYPIRWSPQRFLDDPTSFKPTIVPLGSTPYVIRVTDTLGCTHRITYEVKNRKIDLGFGKEIEYLPCDGLYRVRLFSNRDSSDRYVWTFGPGEDTVSGPEVRRVYTRNGRYPIRLNGIKSQCEENVFDTLNLNNQKVTILPSFREFQEYEGCDPKFVRFQNSTQNAIAFIWDFGDGFKSTETNPRHRYGKTGTFTVTLEAFKDGCKEIFTKTITLEPVEIPSLVTRDKNGQNEEFNIKGLPEGSDLDVFNRWGKRIFSASNYQNNWVPDDIDEGVYYFSLRFPEGGCRSWVQVLKEQ